MIVTAPSWSPCLAHDWLFVLSTGRTGSTTILNMLNAVPQIYLSGETGAEVLKYLDRAFNSSMHRRPQGTAHYQEPNERALRNHACAWLLNLLPRPSPTVRPECYQRRCVRGMKTLHIGGARGSGLLPILAQFFPSSLRVVLSSRDNKEQQLRSAPFMHTNASTITEKNEEARDALNRMGVAWRELQLERFSPEAFTSLIVWLGIRNCSYTRLLHANDGKLAEKQWSNKESLNTRGLLSGTCVLPQSRLHAAPSVAALPKPLQPSSMTPSQPPSLPPPPSTPRTPKAHRRLEPGSARVANGSVYMLLANGCTGSSWVTQTAHALLEAHGVHVLNRGMDTEPETVDSSSVVAKERIHALAGTEHIRGASRAVEWLKNRTLAPSESLFFKAENPKAEHLLPATRIFQSMGVVVHAVSMRRVNALATVVCLVRDCFDTRTGTSVDAVTGRRDTLCFRRRFNTSVRIKARVNVSQLPGALELASQQATVLAALPGQLGLDVERGPSTVSYERLSAFEYRGGGASWEERALRVSAREWSALLRAWGVAANETRVGAYLAARWRSRGAQLSADTIANVDDVHAALLGTRWAGYLQMSR